ncbi:alpha-L-fucosidase [Algibacter mikhailovii]|uniref:alpha-L-fucosidase n=1 Tax=Algibacter mikhailovii TaxID=425498 RepID=UPI0024956CA4|nr:alpha-L-fucosidase [Algibacter mikhailovii]
MKKIILLLVLVLFVFNCNSKKESKDTQIKHALTKKYEPNWESLSKHNAEAEWLKDAKLGIYFHWGPYSVPAFGNEWYPRNMYLSDSKPNKHHINTYGRPEKFGYHDFVPMFTADHFDAENWAELFELAGAKFAGPVAEHHDGFSMWDSEVTPWNAMDKGPKKDVLGDLFKALEKRNLKTIATFHHARNLQRYKDSWENEIKDSIHRRSFRSSHYPYLPEFQEIFDDPEYRLLYGSVPEDEWNEKIWLGKLKEVIDKYKPDIIWFDSWLDQIPETYRKQFSAYYLNAAEDWDKEVVIVRKQNDLPLEISINDHEKSREPKALKELWMTDDTFSTGSWCYTDDLVIKPTDKVLHALIDAVSKNGILLLNISPMSNGIIPDNQRKGLLELGKWLKINGEAIYNTRPWINAAEGPTAEPSGGFKDHKKFLGIEYTSKDIRYTVSKDGKTVYAMTLGIPENNEEIILKTFASENVKVKDVSTLSGASYPWEMTDVGLKIESKNNGNNYAQVYRITLDK